jgi:valyl-tRNA synthetase
MLVLLWKMLSKKWYVPDLPIDSCPVVAAHGFSVLKGLYVGKEPNKMRLGICSRSGDILEPMITPQWYVNCNGMAKRATEAVRNGELKIVPDDHEKTWFYWLDNIRDWCISRQLWWGHQIPAWFATKVGEINISKNDMDHNDRWIVARSEEVCRRHRSLLP